MAAPLSRNRDYVALWLGQAASNLGISVSSFAYPLVVLGATGSPAKAGLVGSVLAGTAFVLRLPGGALVDRANRRAVLVLCDLGRALNSAAFAVALALGHFFLAQVLLVAFVEAALGVCFGPAESAAVRHVVEPDQRREAVAANQSRSAIPGLVGPPLGGVLLAAGRALPFVADAVSYLVSLVCIVSVRRPLQEPAARRPRQHPVTDVLEGLRWVWAHRFLRALLLWLVGQNVVFSSIGLVILVLARDRGATPGELGVMVAIAAAGAVAGALLAPRILRRMRPFTVVVAFGWLVAAATFPLAVAHSPYVIGALGAAAFMLGPAVNALVFATVAAEAPDRLQGRATSATIQLSGLAAPLGPALAGGLLGALGPVHVVLAYGCALVVLATAASGSRALRLPPAEVRARGLEPPRAARPSGT